MTICEQRNRFDGNFAETEGHIEGSVSASNGDCTFLAIRD
jgi:hypothetical protein